MVTGFVVAAVFVVLFVVAGLPSRSPLLQPRIFRNRTFTISAFVTVVGMFREPVV